LRVIFLDIDGVLNNAGDMNAGAWVGAIDHTNWTKPALAALAEIVARTGAKIVISSTWRKIESEPAWWNKEFAACGLPLDCIGITGSAHNGFRGREVRAWLADHTDVETYVVLDDESDFYLDQPRIYVDSWGGLLQHHVQPAVALLEGGEFMPLRCMEERNPPPEDNGSVMV
jgi:hypothetical protein